MRRVGPLGDGEKTPLQPCKSYDLDRKWREFCESSCNTALRPLDRIDLLTAELAVAQIFVPQAEVWHGANQAIMDKFVAISAERGKR